MSRPRSAARVRGSRRLLRAKHTHLQLGELPPDSVDKLVPIPSGIVHVRDEDRNLYCDYDCPHSQEPLRRDLLRNHLRDVHGEDLPKDSPNSLPPEWLKNRIVWATWWRCCSCLKRVNIERDGSTCPTCNQAS